VRMVSPPQERMASGGRWCSAGRLGWGRVRYGGWGVVRGEAERGTARRGAARWVGWGGQRTGNMSTLVKVMLLKVRAVHAARRTHGSGLPGCALRDMGAMSAPDSRWTGRW